MPNWSKFLFFFPHFCNASTGYYRYYVFSSFHRTVDLLFHYFSCQRLFEKCPLIFDDIVFEQKWLLPKTWQTANAYHNKERNLVQKTWKFILKTTITYTFLHKQEGKFDLIKPKWLLFPFTPIISSAMHRIMLFKL